MAVIAKSSLIYEHFHISYDDSWHCLLNEYDYGTFTHFLSYNKIIDIRSIIIMYAFNIEKIKNLVSVILVNLLHLFKKIGCLYLGSLIVVVENPWLRMRLNSMQIEFQLLKFSKTRTKIKEFEHLLWVF